MVKYFTGDLNRIFGALSDPTRRAILATLAAGAQPVSELARPFAMSLPGFMKHLDMLEDAGLLTRVKEGRVVTCTLQADPMREAQVWLTRYQKFWEVRLDALARYLDEKEQAWTPSASNDLRSPSGASTAQHRRKSGKPGSSRKR